MRSSIEATPSHVLTRKKLARTLGWVIEDAQVVEILKRLRAKVESTDEGWRTTPPSDRCDWAMHADSIEEILRLSDRSQCPEVWPVVRMQPSASTHVSASNAMADYFAARGFAECVNYSFIDPKDQAHFSPCMAALTLNNPIRPELSYMRGQLWSGLLRTALFNLRHQKKRMALFELGQVFDAQDGIPSESLALAALALGDERAEVSVMIDEARRFLRHHFGQRLDVCAAESQGLHPGQSAALRVDDLHVGWVGALHPSVCRAFDLPNHVVLMSLT